MMVRHSWRTRAVASRGGTINRGVDGMKDRATRRYNAFLVRPAFHRARREEGLTVLHVQSGDVALAVAPDAAVRWIQQQTTTRRFGPNQTWRDDNQQYGALPLSEKE